MVKARLPGQETEEAYMGSSPRSGRSPGEGNGNTFQHSCLENPVDKRSLVGYSPWGRTELDMTEVP